MKEIENGIVFSNDISRILKGNNALDFKYDKRGMYVPSDSFIATLRDDFKKEVENIFKNQVVIVSEDEMLESMNNCISDILDIIPIVSLDKIYLTQDNGNIKFLDCTRLDGDSGLISRKYCNDLGNVDKQIKKLANELIVNGENQIILVDDVVFSGNVLKKIIEMFKEYGIEVMGIRSCIATSEAYNYFNSILPLKLKCGYLLGQEVIDQVCERDFYFGIAQSGISIQGENGVIYKAPYFYPFGNPNERASIPMEDTESFSQGCIQRSIRLFKEIEEISSRDIYTSELPEKINGVPEEERVLKLLKRNERRI